jgi:C4-dicarboxylate-specific signal transduction histidine kinase
VCQPATDEKGEFLGFRASNRDITERKQAEEQMNQLRSELVHAARTGTMGEMTAALAHELNHPLGSILNNANAARRFLRQDSPDLDEIRDIINDIISEDRRAYGVMQKVRNLMKKTELGLAPVRINEIIEEVLTLTRSECLIENVDLSTEQKEHLPEVAGERIQLQQVFINLIMNAVDAMKESKTRELRISTALHGADNVVVCIRDTGCGLSDKAKDNLFKPFFTTKKEGMGMGLSVTRTIVESHGGDIWAENNEGAGASFFVTLPHSKER